MHTTKQNLHFHHGLRHTGTPQSKTYIFTTDYSVHVHNKEKLTFSPWTKADMYTTKQNSHFHHGQKRTYTPQPKLKFSTRTKGYMYTT